MVNVEAPRQSYFASSLISCPLRISSLFAFMLQFPAVTYKGWLLPKLPFRGRRDSDKKGGCSKMKKSLEILVSFRSGIRFKN